jgi:hypothetical protein
MHLDFALGVFRIKHAFAFNEMLNLFFMFIISSILREEANKEIWTQNKCKFEPLNIWIKTKEGYGVFKISFRT